MRTAALFFGGLVLSALASGPAAAEPVRVRVMARVIEIFDPNNELAGDVVYGQQLNGTYVYDTNTPDQAPEPNWGQYQPYANAASMSFVAGSHVFESSQPTQEINIDIWSSLDGFALFRMRSGENKPLANGADVHSIELELAGAWNTDPTDGLPKVAPDLPNIEYEKEVTISAGSFYLRAVLEAAELIKTPAMVVSPASGSFVERQDFDAALILPPNSAVASMQATANGRTLHLSYPGTCYLQAPNSAGNPSLVCPDADSELWPGFPAQIEWTVTLTNGTVLTETVNWELAW